MEGYARYAIYLAPPPGPLAAFAAAWLGWDAESGRGLPHPEIGSLPHPIGEITAAPRRYGFHGTLKPPFRLAEGTDIVGLHAATAALASHLPRVRLDGLAVAELGAFLALVPTSQSTPLTDLAATIVEALDRFRAPASPEELIKRRAAGLSPAQDANLARWGYPYVMEEFRFHMTLTGRLDSSDLSAVKEAITPHITPLLPVPYFVRDLCLFGEGPDGRFHLLHRYPLAG